MTRFYVEGMVCSGCERTVCRVVRKLSGVKDVRADYKNGKLEIAFSAPCTQEKIEEAVRQAGYEITSRVPERRTAVYWLVIVAGLYVIFRQLGITTLFQTFPTVTGPRGGYVSLFLIGLMTSVHCVAMCGGLNAAQSMHSDSMQVLHSSLMYNLGRLSSYTLIGGILGFIGERAAVTLGVRAWIGAAAGIWMLLLGVKMLTGITIPFQLRVHFPAGLQALVLRLSGQGSFVLGLMNALMPCGPLQSMQLYAVASGSFFAGAASMFSFCLGTIPLVLLVGTTLSWLKRSWKRRMLQAGAALLVIMGLSMLFDNLALSGIGVAPTQGNAVAAVIDGDTQYVMTELRSNGYDSIEVQAGIPVVWTIRADSRALNGCNNEVIVPEFGIQKKLNVGDTRLEFTPTEPGIYLYSCWMGMLKSTIVVTNP